ncbi:amidohydrolase [Microcella sp.]|uniref:amidohydrolase n=1 Tax=Microcella sp. TaxID=1913979 RepID=UPI00255F49F2|nr:amidohydrolase [Microcella sp.]MBX9471548.1 amidohydrolase [Microcella sp.]
MSTASRPEPPADLLFTGGVVYRGPGRSAVSEALEVAVIDGRIAAIDADLTAWRGPATEVVDLAGGMLHAGFVDAHIHPIQGGLERLGCDLSSGSSAQDYARLIADYAQLNPPRGCDASRAWITGGGWAMSAFPGGTPSAAELDALEPIRPVFLYNRDHHGAWANSAALALAGITAETPDPADGRIERLPDGSPQGTLHEGAAALVAAVAPAATPDDEYAALLEAQRYAHSFGITAWQDAIVGDYFGASDTALVYRRALAEGRLTVDVVGALWWDRNRGIEQVPELVAKREAHAAELGPDARFRLSAVKIMADGVVENGTASMLEPYLVLDGAAPSEHPTGIAFVGGQALSEAIVALDAAGFSAHVHVIGDRAVRDALDAFEAAAAANDWASRAATDARRHHLAHLQFVHPDDVARFAALGVTANMQALWACNEPQMRDLTVPLVGTERAATQYPFASILRAVVVDARPRLCAGSDWPVSTPDPWQAIHVAVNRTLPADDPERDPEPLLAHEALTLAVALDAYTAGSAFINGRGPGDAHVTGIIEVGSVADLAATNRDPFAGPEASIHATRNVGTWVAGRRAHG